jgi:putative ABC transport system ATP-binding protein
MTPLLACRDVEVAFEVGGTAVRALAGVTLELADRETLALVGRSGSGKTTLLHVLGGLVEPTAGEVRWRRELPKLDGDRPLWRVAYVFQGANLLPHLTARENVAFAARASRSAADPDALIGLVGLSAKAGHLPEELSGGEAQRIALARALAQEPDTLLCDEPTGHLDSDTGERVLDLIDALRAEHGFALVVATHDLDVAARYERSVELQDGRVVAEVRA